MHEDKPRPLMASTFRSLPRTGVIYAMTEARRFGYSAEDAHWVNFGQGAPEVAELDGAIPRLTHIEARQEDYEYAPAEGLGELREAIAHLYNVRYRQGKSQYSSDNVAICGGGRQALTRVVATLGRTNVGHFLPDYTAYEELLGSFGNFVAIPMPLDPDVGYQYGPDKLRHEILSRGLSAILLSNPSNPTGRVLRDDVLDGWLKVCRELSCTLITDEFYSHFIYGDKLGETISAAEHVDDVEDSVVILDGITKNWRYPGWRVAWIVGPRQLIDAIGSAGSFMDGGAARPLQRAILPLVTPEAAAAEALAIQNAFRPKRDLLRSGLESMGIAVRPEPGGSFYCWGSLEQLPEPLQGGTDFFEAALRHKLIVIPGRFFDINPGQRRPDRPSRFRSYVRFSFGPSADNIERGLEKLEALLGEY